jgi:hypothetical protein
LNLRPLPPCPYQAFSTLFPGKETQEVYCDECGGSISWPSCTASRAEGFRLYVSCRAVLEAELCPEGWR